MTIATQRVPPFYAEVKGALDVISQSIALEGTPAAGGAAALSGTATRATELAGRPIVVMTSVGARTGLVRKTPVIRIEHQGEYAVLASNGGSAAPPHWYYRLKKHPHVELQDGGTKKDYLAREAAGAERALWGERAVAVWPDFDQYTVRLDRTIPLFVLRPVGAPR